MKKIMFNDNFRFTESVLLGHKTMERKVITNKVAIAHCEKGYTDLALNYAAYQVGDIVAIAQSYNDCLYDAHTECEINGKDAMLYETAGWNNKMFVKADLMPHHIRITDVLVERMQNISYGDCLFEGVRRRNSLFGYRYYVHEDLPIRRDPRLVIADIVGKLNWERNPYVFVYKFELVH